MDIPNSENSSDDDERTSTTRYRTPLHSASVLQLQSRRNANDPHMMKELQRYQRIMFLTLLPSISNSDNAASIQPQLNLNELPQQQSFKNYPPEGAIITMQQPPGNQTTRKLSLQDRKSSFPNLGAVQKDKARRISDIGNRANKPMRGHSPLASIASATVKKQEGGLQPAPTDTHSEVSHPPIDQVGNNLDFTTLTALYLESRKKIFGDEWSNRSKSDANRDEIGKTGITKPRRLTPLEVSGLSEAIELPDPYSNNFNDDQSLLHWHTMPTPAGLHLSANFTQSFGSDPNDSRERSRKGSHRSRLRRLNSLDELSLTCHEDHELPVGSLHRPNSAPGVSKKVHDSGAIPMETPARANTPTEPNSSARVIRLQLIGGSLATYSPDQSIAVPDDTKNEDENTFRPIRRSLPLPKKEDLIASPILKRPPRKDSRIRLSPLETSNKKHSFP